MVFQEIFPLCVFLLTVSVWDMACSSRGATQEALTEAQAASRDHLNKAIRQLPWLDCQNHGSVRVSLLSKDFLVLLGLPARAERGAGTLGR